MRSSILCAGKAPHFAGKYIEAGHIAFFAMCEEHLLAYAYAQQGFAGCGSQHSIAQAGSLERAQAVGHGALAGKHHTAGPIDIVRRTAKFNVGIGGSRLQRAPHRMKIAHAVIDDGDSIHGNQPLRL
jgi:hypothetical protein